MDAYRVCLAELDAKIRRRVPIRKGGIRLLVNMRKVDRELRSTFFHEGKQNSLLGFEMDVGAILVIARLRFGSDPI